MFCVLPLSIDSKTSSANQTFTMSIPLVYHPDYVTPLPPEHRFPMPKFGRVYEHLVTNGIASLDQFHCPEIADRSMLTLAHTADFVDSYLSGTIDAKAMRRIGFPWSPALVNRTCAAIGGTILTARLALAHGLACNVAGGTHHSYADFGSGYCIFNDLAIAARVVQEEGLAKRVLIVDLDVHQGDGTASIFQHDESVFTFSMHCGKNFPFRKQVSDLDIALPVDSGDTLYLAELATHLGPLLDPIDERRRPDLVLYDAGVDPHVADRLGKLALTSEGLAQRDQFVLESCAKRGIPVASVLGGGYSNDINELARRHSSLYRAADAAYTQYSSSF